MYLSNSDIKLWDLSHVSELINALSVKEWQNQERDSSTSNLKPHLEKDVPDFKSSPSTLGDFSNIWKQLDPVTVVVPAAAAKHTPALTEDNTEGVQISDSQWRECFKNQTVHAANLEVNDVFGGDLTTRNAFDEQVKSRQLRPAKPNRAATCSSNNKVKFSDTVEVKGVYQKRFFDRNKDQSSDESGKKLQKLRSKKGDFGKAKKITNRSKSNSASETIVSKPAQLSDGANNKSNGKPTKKLPNHKRANWAYSDSEICSRVSCKTKSKSLNSEGKHVVSQAQMVLANGKPAKKQGLEVADCAGGISKYSIKSTGCGNDRYLSLLIKLVRDFSEEKSWLAKPVQLADHLSSPNGIHVFIDFSNISIGFNNYMKIVEGISLDTRTKFKNISFEALVLLMERKRPVSKRVLAGSLPLVPAFEMARAVGYELNILDKVFKAKEVKISPKGKSKNSTKQSPSIYNQSSGSESVGTGKNASLVNVSEKWVEQGVDEILHLKILESVVDVEKPTTMVLGTGDGAVAEYSQGFFAMVERALRKGWNVELVSWGHNIGFVYKKRSFRSTWGERFRIIELDKYAMELLDI